MDLEENKSLTLDEYAEFVAQMVTPEHTADFISKITAGGLGLAGEAGEVADIAKKFLFQRMEFTDEVKQKMTKEVGDCLFYIAFICRFVLGISIQDAIDANHKKLTDRYKTGTFTVEEFQAKEKSKQE